MLFFNSLEWKYLGKFMLGQTITFENPLSELEIYGFTPYFTYVYHTRVPISHLIGGTEDSKKSYQNISVMGNSDNKIISAKLENNTQDGVSNSNGYIVVYGR